MQKAYTEYFEMTKLDLVCHAHIKYLPVNRVVCFFFNKKNSFFFLQNWLICLYSAEMKWLIINNSHKCQIEDLIFLFFLFDRYEWIKLHVTYLNIFLKKKIIHLSAASHRYRKESSSAVNDSAATCNSTISMSETRA